MDLAGGRDLGHISSIVVKYDHHQEVYSTANLSLPRSVVYLTILTVRSVHRLSERPVVDTSVGAFEVPSGTSNERISALKWQFGTRDAEIVAKVVQANSIGRCH